MRAAVDHGSGGRSSGAGMVRYNGGQVPGKLRPIAHSWKAGVISIPAIGFPFPILEALYESLRPFLFLSLRNTWL